MKILPYTRMFCDKTVGLLRNLSQQRLQHAISCDKDAPVEMENPYIKEKRKCILCKYNIEPDYKNVRLLSQFQSRFTGRIYGRHITGLCKKRQEQVEIEITKAQQSGLMGFYTKEIKYVNDPKLYDLNNPFKPHKY